jgi:hypothetical protein
VARPNWEYIRVDVLLPGHEKLDGLSAASKWLLVELWCWCGQYRNDGFVRDAKWKTFGTPSARDALVTRGLAERGDGGWIMHDFVGPDGHQRSRAEIDELSARRAEAGRKGGQARGKPQALA